MSNMSAIHTTEIEQPALVALVPRVNIGIFCDNPQSAALMQAVASDRRMAKAHVNVQLGGIPAAAQFYSQEPTPNVVIVESHGDRAGCAQVLRQPREESPILESAKTVDDDHGGAGLGRRVDVAADRQPFARGDLKH